MNYEDLEGEFKLYSASSTIKDTLREIHKNMGVTDALGRFVTSSFDAIDRLTSVAVKLKNVELEEAILALKKELIQINKSLLDVQKENLGLYKENIELQEENRKLKEQIAQPKQKTPRRPFNDNNITPLG